MQRILLAATTAAIAGSLGLSASASATTTSGLPSLPLPSLPGLPSLPSTGGLPGLPSAGGLGSLPLGGLLGTGAQCTGGLITLQLGGTTICVAPSVPSLPQSTSCGTGLLAVDVAGQGVVCVTPDPTTIQVLPTTTTNTANCADGLVPVQIAGGSIGCLLATLVGDAGANGTNGTNGSNGSNGSNGAGGSSGTSGTSGTSGSSGGSSSAATPSSATSGGGGVTAAGTSSTPAGTLALVKPTLSLSKTVRGSTKGTVRSATAKVVVTLIGKRKGRTVRFTRQVSLKRTGASSAARPYSGSLRIAPKTTGTIQIRITSRAAGQVKTATFKRTAKR